MVRQYRFILLCLPLLMAGCGSTAPGSTLADASKTVYSAKNGGTTLDPAVVAKSNIIQHVDSKKSPFVRGKSMRYSSKGSKAFRNIAKNLRD